MLDDRVMASMRFHLEAPATSPLYQYILQAVTDDIARGGACEEVLSHTPADIEPVLDALALRFLGGVHRIVLEGRAPDLAARYPSAGGTFDSTEPGDTSERFLSTVAENREELIESLARGVQTNEVGRCAALLLGFLTVARKSGLPLRVLEVGASAGLNLRWDRYRYEGGAHASAWGDATSPLRFENVYLDPLPDLDVAAAVVERAGCDRSPIDPTTDEGALTLRSYVWPDQLERFAALDAALELAPTVDARVEQADAGDWVEAQLASLRPGMATVLYHSVVWQYLPAETRRRVVADLEEAGASSVASAPLAWLRMEPGHDPTKSAEVTLTQWPGGQQRLLARSGYHGRPVRPTGS